jgi:hypothetical protein
MRVLQYCVHVLIGGADQVCLAYLIKLHVYVYIHGDYIYILL